MTRNDPQQSSRFVLQIDGITVAQFNEVTIPDISSNPIDWRHGDENSYAVMDIIRALNEIKKFDEIVNSR